MYDIIIQTIGIIGIIPGVLTFQCKRHKPLMVLKTTNEMIFALQYFMLGAYTGMAMNIIGSIRNLIFAKLVEKNKSTLIPRVAFSGFFLLFSVFTYAGFKSILIGIAKIVSTFAYGNKNVALVRIMILFTSIIWFIYNFVVKSYAGALNELLTICSIIIGIIRLDIPKKKA